MSFRPTCFSLKLLVLLLALPTWAETPAPSREEVLLQSTVIALGSVEQLDGRSGRPLATLRVEHVARGEPRDVITFYADAIDSVLSLAGPVRR
ncbi:MAG TPA: hypothetical protein VF815_09905 [Myxococcaceae bacterium]|jgi:hypothetical protein